MVSQMENQRLYTIVDRLNTRGSDHTSDTASQLSDMSSYAPREVTHLPGQTCLQEYCVTTRPLTPEASSTIVCSKYSGSLLWCNPDQLSVPVYSMAPL